MIGFAKRTSDFLPRQSGGLLLAAAVFSSSGCMPCFLGTSGSTVLGMSGVRYLMDSWIMAGLLP
jgi:hypothetical protein